jgi:hypothetical protein
MQMPKMNTNPRKIRRLKRTRGIFSPAFTIGAGMDELPAFCIYQWATPIYKTWQNSAMAGCPIVLNGQCVCVCVCGGGGGGGGNEIPYD